LPSTSREAVHYLLTAFEDRLYIEQALAIGVDGYLTKDVSREELITSLQSVMKGERVFSHSIFSILHGMHSRQSVETLSTVTLTKREEEILDLVAKGLTSNEIANRSFISPRTVETHRAHLMEKLCAKNTAALVRYAIVSQQHRRPGSPLKRIFAEQILIPVVRLLPGDSTYWGQMHSSVLDVILEK